MGIDYDPNNPFLPQYLGNMVAFSLAVPACYFAAYTLTTRYLYQKKIKTFLLYVLLLVIINTIITYLISLSVYHLLTGLPMFRSPTYVIYLGSVMFYYDVMLISISCAVKIIADRFSMEQRLFEVEKERISTELNFLRSQVNPHFLFNVMNTIYFQIDKGNIQARASVETLSEMLRYQLYECTTDKIDIGKEVEYIRNYVAMQTLRMEKGTNIILDIDNNLSGFFIAPLLLLPIIENAFKHISGFKNPADNKIHISLQNELDIEFSVQVINTFDKASNTKHLLNSGGLGMQNLKRRLNLLYPGKHLFTIDQQENLFTTSLKIQYND
jgi:two-component system, LytTR family, sensor kinase